MLFCEDAAAALAAAVAFIAAVAGIDPSGALAEIAEVAGPIPLFEEPDMGGLNCSFAEEIGAGTGEVIRLTVPAEGIETREAAEGVMPNPARLSAELTLVRDCN